MVYDSLDIIPSKLFFKIADTGDVRLLSKDKDVDIEVLKKIWSQLEEEDAELSQSDTLDKLIENYAKIERLSAKFKCIALCVRYLRFKKDDDLISQLRNYGFQIRWGRDKIIEGEEATAEAIFQYDLDEVVRLSEDIGLQIERIKSRIPKQKKNAKQTPFDEVVMGYAAFTGAGFIDTNSITQTQYRALINLGAQKIKSLENNGQGK